MTDVEEVTASEAARMLGVSRQRVETLIRRKDLPVRRTRTNVMIPKDAVANYRTRPERAAAAAADGYLTLPQVADKFGVTVRTAQNWCDSGLLPFERLPPMNRRAVRAEVAAQFVPPRRGRPAEVAT